MLAMVWVRWLHTCLHNIATNSHLQKIIANIHAYIIQPKTSCCHQNKEISLFSGQNFGLVSLAKIALGTGDSALAMMSDLAEIRATLVRTTTGGPGRRATVMIAPELTTSQRRAVKAFELDRWMPTLLSCMTTRPVRA